MFNLLSAALMSSVLWQEELAEVQKQEARVSKQLSAAQQENGLLTEELCELQQKLPELQSQLQQHEQNKDSMAVRLNILNHLLMAADSSLTHSYPFRLV